MDHKPAFMHDKREVRRGIANLILDVYKTTSFEDLWEFLDPFRVEAWVLDGHELHQTAQTLGLIAWLRFIYAYG